MKNRLQYAYSISVFFGVLVTAYLMMNKEGNARIPLRAFQGPATLRTEAVAVEPGVDQLFHVEDQLSKLPREEDEKLTGKKRAPSEIKSVR